MYYVEKTQLFNDDCQVITGNTIISSTFSLSQEKLEKVVLVLTPKYVFYHPPTDKLKRKGFILGFDVCFQILRKKIDPTEKQPSGDVSGIRFQSSTTNTQEFYSSNTRDIQKWEAQLKKYLNQYNFHSFFKAEKRLGKGNFATVYLGAQKKDGKKVAIKAFGKQVSFCQQNGKQALINQVKITRLFNHPNLMKMQGVFQSDNSIYFILEFIEGQPICNRIKNLLKYTQAQRRVIMKGVLRGLSQMARKNVIHRDLKPENVILNKEPIIIDFGLATIADQHKYLFVRCGTPGYVAPEIINIKDMETKSHPISDIFSAGCIFYYIIFNKHLFNGKTGQQVIALNRQCDIILSGPQFDRLNPKQTDLLRKMLQKEPQSRISAAQALKHPYFVDVQDRIFIPKIQMKQSGLCPIDLLAKDNQAAVKFIMTTKKQPIIQTYDKTNLTKKIQLLNTEQLIDF